MSLTNKVVLVTGGGTGIGADAARGFHAAGAKVILNGRREEILAKTASQIDPSGKNISYVAGDIGRQFIRGVGPQPCQPGGHSIHA